MKSKMPNPLKKRKNLLICAYLHKSSFCFQYYVVSKKSPKNLNEVTVESYIMSLINRHPVVIWEK